MNHTPINCCVLSLFFWTGLYEAGTYHLQLNLEPNFKEFWLGRLERLDMSVIQWLVTWTRSLFFNPFLGNNNFTGEQLVITKGNSKWWRTLHLKWQCCENDSRETAAEENFGTTMTKHPFKIRSELVQKDNRVIRMALFAVQCELGKYWWAQDECMNRLGHGLNLPFVCWAWGDPFPITTFLSIHNLRNHTFVKVMAHSKKQNKKQSFLFQKGENTAIMMFLVSFIYQDMENSSTINGFVINGALL